MTVPVAPNDLTWLHMDRDNNLMYTHGMLWFEQAPDWDAVEQILRERMVTRFPVFGRRAREIDGVWMWEDDPEFSLDRHVRRVTLPAPGSHAQAQEYVSSRYSQPFDPAHPLWEMDLISGAHDISDGDGAIVLARFHHAIADGVRIVQLLLSLLDPLSDDVLPASVGRGGGGGGGGGPVHVAVQAVRSTAWGAADFVNGAAAALARVPERMGTVRPSTLAAGVMRLRRPASITDAISEMASDENAVVNTWRSLARLGVARSSVTTVWSGTPGVDKRLWWITGVSLAQVRLVGREHGATVNDVLLSAVSLGLTEYLAEHGETGVDALTWMIPVSLEPLSAGAPDELGNKFAIVLLPMPIGIHDPHTLLRTMHSRMNRIKNSAEPAIVYGLQRTVAEVPEPLAVALTNFVANKSVGLITNVPGPRAAMALAGTEVAAILGYGPPTADHPLAFSIFSYNGTVNFGVATDVTLVPDPEGLVRHLEQAIERLLGHHGTPQDLPRDSGDQGPF
jgi:diacylglycerol O-acyltransferase